MILTRISFLVVTIAILAAFPPLFKQKIEIYDEKNKMSRGILSSQEIASNNREVKQCLLNKLMKKRDSLFVSNKSLVNADLDACIEEVKLNEWSISQEKLLRESLENE